LLAYAPIEIKLAIANTAAIAPLSGGEFTFGLFDQRGIELCIALNDTNGFITFPTIRLSSVGIYHYTAKAISAPTGWDMDLTEWPIEIKVQSSNNKLHVQVTHPNDIPSVKNTLNGITCGTFEFPEMTFSEPGVYEYIIKEITPPGDGWSKDERIIKVIVTVVDDGHGNLVATVSYPDGYPTFTNTYNLI